MEIEDEATAAVEQRGALPERGPPQAAAAGEEEEKSVTLLLPLPWW